MKKILILLVISFSLIACNAEENEPINKAIVNNFVEETVEDKENSLAPIFSRLEKEEDYKAGETILFYLDLEAPFIENAKGILAFEKINDFYKKEFEQLNQEGEEFLAQAQRDYDSSKELDYNFNPYGLTSFYEITEETTDFISILSHISTYTGGAHPNGFVRGKTFDLKTGEMITLSDILGLSDAEALTWVKGIVEEKLITEEDMGYYPDVLDIYQASLSMENFYIRDQKIMVYFDAYAIAPYAAGYPEFEIPMK